MHGSVPWPLNPRHIVPRGYLHVVRLWNRCRAGMGGLAVLPEAGGINQQPAWLIHAFGMLDAADEEMRRAEEAERGAHDLG